MNDARLTSTRVVVLEEGCEGDPAATDAHHHGRVEEANHVQLALLTELVSTTSSTHVTRRAAAVDHSGDAENARHEIAGHENSAPD